MLSGVRQTAHINPRCLVKKSYAVGWDEFWQNEKNLKNSKRMF